MKDMTNKKSSIDPKEQRLALVVGVNNSAQSSYLASLKYAENDAYEIARVLQQEECNFSLVTPALLGREAATLTVKSAVLELGRKRADTDFLLFYFSGHAQPLKMADEREDIYFVTHDFDPSLAEEDDTMYLSMRWLKEHLYQSKGAGSIVIILDCCYAGNIANAESIYDLDLRKLINGFFDDSAIEEHPNALRLILSATGHNSTAHEQDGHGCMTHLLLQALTGQIAKVKDTEGAIDMHSVYQYLQRQLPEQAPVLSGKTTRPCILAIYPTENNEASTAAIIPHKVPSLQSPNLPFDCTVCRDASFEDLDAEAIDAFFQLERVRNEDNFSPSLSTQVQLEHLVFLQNGSPTYAALLCFGIKPSQWVPEAVTRCTHWVGHDRLVGWHKGKDQRYRGNLIKQYNSALKFLADILSIDPLVIVPGTQQEQWELPRLALREALTNALIHREYVDCTSFVHVEIFEDRVEIKSPGDLPVPLKITSLGREGNTHRRNPQITSIFNLYGYVEEAGSGIPRMRKEMKDARLRPPKLDISNISESKMFRVVFWRRQKITARRKITLVSASAAIISVLLTCVLIFRQSLPPVSCPPTAQSLPNGQLTCVSGNIAVGGGTAIEHFVKSAANQYVSRCPGAHISIQGTSDLNGLDEVEKGSINIAISSLSAPSNQTDLVDYWATVVVYAVIVNRDVHVANLTTSDLHNIYNGNITNWDVLGGAHGLQIHPLSRDNGSGTRFTFDQYVLGGAELVSQSSPIPDVLSMIKAVEQTPGGIGYADLYDIQIGAQPVNMVSIDGKVSTMPSSIQNNSYRFWSAEGMYTKGVASGLSRAFINYIGNSNVKEIAQTDALVGINDMQLGSLSAHCLR